MTKRMNEFSMQWIESNTKIISGTSGRSAGWDAENEKHQNRAHARDVEFLMQCGIDDAEGLPKGVDAVENFMREHVVVLKRLKRCAVLKVGKVVFFINRFGVLTATYKDEGLPLQGWETIFFARLGPEIRRVIGSTYQSNGREYIFDYSNCEVCKDAA